jgi:hypothetical protein
MGDQLGGPEYSPPRNQSMGLQTPRVKSALAPQQPVISPVKKFRPDRCGATTLGQEPQPSHGCLVTSLARSSAPPPPSKNGRLPPGGPSGNRPH